MPDNGPLIQIDDGNGGGTGDGTLELSNAYEGPPTIVGPDGIEVTPAYVKSVEWRGASETETYQTRCGDTITEIENVSHFSPSLQGLVTRSQALELVEMDPEGEPVEIRTPFFTREVSFDTFTITEKDELGRADFEIDGRDVEEPVASFLLEVEEEEGSE